MKCCVKRLAPEGIPFNTSVWMLAVVKITLSTFTIRLTHFLSFFFSLSFCLSSSVSFSNQRVSIRPCYSFSGRCICSDTLMCRGHVDHVWVRLPPQGPSRGGLEVGWLQRGCRVWGAGVQGVCGRQRKPSRRSLSNESAQQRGGTHGKHIYY